MRISNSFILCSTVDTIVTPLAVMATAAVQVDVVVPCGGGSRQG
jgi:hypothetical protein